MNFFESLQDAYPKSGDQLESYLRRVAPPLDPEALQLELLMGTERLARLNQISGFTGEASLYLSYKGSGGMIACLSLYPDDTLNVLQFKGVRSKKAYRIYSGVNVLRLYSDEIAGLARSHRQAISGVCVARIAEGISLAPDVDGAIARNEMLGSAIQNRLLQQKG